MALLKQLGLTLPLEWVCKSNDGHNMVVAEETALRFYKDRNGFAATSATTPTNMRFLRMVRRSFEFQLEEANEGTETSKVLGTSFSARWTQERCISP